MKQPTLTVIMPCYNERDTIADAIHDVQKETHDGLINITISKQIIIVDDGSSDGSSEIIDTFKHNKNIIIIHKKNGGKGSAIKAAIPYCKGKYVLIQDCDLEYRSIDYPLLLYPASMGFKAIFGSRYMNVYNERNQSSHLTFQIGGTVLTAFANLLYGTKHDDCWTGYKVVELELLKSLDLQSDGFEICAEYIVKLAKKGIRVFTVPINYFPRKAEEGKKIKWQDGAKIALKLIEGKWFV